MVQAGLRNRLREQFQPLIKRMRADAQKLRHFANRLPAHRDLMHRILLERIAEIDCPQIDLLALKLEGKAFSDLRASQLHATRRVGMSLKTLNPSDFHEVILRDP